MADFEPLPLPILDPRNEAELVEQSLVRVFNASGGRLNDFSSSSVARALLEGLGFSGAELLYYLNQLPLALVMKYLQISGVTRRLGTKAVVTLTFTLRQALGAPYTIPQGFQVLGGRYSFTTDTLLVIPQGAIAGEVTATADEVGTDSNLPAYTINSFTQPLAFLSAVINTEPAGGGTDEELLEDAIARGLAAIRRRNLVTADDYEEEAVSILGEGSVAKAIGLLGGGRIEYQLGAVHVFCLNANGNAPNDAQLAELRRSLSERVQIGTSLYVSPIELVNIDADLTAKLIPGRDPTEVAETLWEAYQEHLDQLAFTVGESVILKEVEYALRLAGGIEYIQALTLNEQGTNIAMPYPYSLPRANAIYCTLVNDTGGSDTIILGDPQFVSFD